MPYKKQKIPFEEVSELIRGKKLSPPRLAVILGCSTPTARAKLNEPSRFTLGDIERIIRFGHIEIEAIRGAIKI